VNAALRVQGSQLPLAPSLPLAFPEHHPRKGLGVSKSEGDEAEVAQAIMGYLAEQPHAMDTLEGIAEWWLMRHHVRVSVETLNQVLRGLVERGQLDAIGTGEHRRYRLKS
jgi:hypothetical protein